MAQRFILLDNSLKEAGGHHLEYARQVLIAAKQAGFTTLLATHLDCQPIAHESIDMVMSVFHYGLWENALSEETPHGSFKNRIRLVLKRIYVHLSSEYPGFMRLLPRPFFVVLSPLLAFFTPAACAGKKAFIERFIHDLSALSLTQDDIIFVPNLGNVEFEAISQFTAACPHPLHWHLLFRRNLFEGSEPSYDSELAQPSLRLNATLEVFKRHAQIPAYFYTDTNALTEQYNRLGIFSFHTLPIPLAPIKKHAPKTSQKPLNILYMGDARDEKGFPLLTSLISDMQAAGYNELTMHFTIQSNFNIVRGEAASRRTKTSLQSLPQAFVTLKEGPFTSDDYYALIASADIVLLPYEAQRYYARSSGIFAECLAAAIPVVSCGKSWMSQSLLDKQQAYFNQLLATHEPLQIIPVIQKTTQYTPKNPHSLLIIRAETQSPLTGHFIDVRAHHTDPNLIKTVSIDLRISQPLICIRTPKERTALSFSSSIAENIHYTLFEIACEPAAQSYAASFFTDTIDFSAALQEMIEHYPRYEAQATSIQADWALLHNPHRLVKILLQNQA